MKHVFSDESLLELALTHSSWAYSNGGEHNERLEFLGDSVLQLCTTEMLYLEHKREPEGVLSRYRSQLVKNEFLGSLAREWKLDVQIRLGPSLQNVSSERELDRVLAGAFEAVLGAIFLDGGFSAAQAELKNLLSDRLHNLSIRDVRQTLDEWCQAHHGECAVFEVQRHEGPDHDRIFFAGVWVSGQLVGEGSGRTKRLAFTAAATEALQALKITP